MNCITTWDGHFIRTESCFNVILNFNSILKCSPYFKSGSHKSTVFYYGREQIIENFNSSFNYINDDHIISLSYSINQSILKRTILYKNYLKNLNYGLLNFRSYDSMIFDSTNIIENEGNDLYMFYITCITYMTNIYIFNNNFLFINTISKFLYLTNCFIEFEQPLLSSLIISNVNFNDKNIKTYFLILLNTALCENNNNNIFSNKLNKFLNLKLILLNLIYF